MEHEVRNINPRTIKIEQYNEYEEEKKSSQIIDRHESKRDSSRDKLDKLLGSNPSKESKPNPEIDSTIRS